mmetsp:Transcript_22237/g.56112  ORF Transcript_22237/g.56112 Transcript_22237/m.56112 type:complete len:858 (-) Transcript_22237:347-2920(-)
MRFVPVLGTRLSAHAVSDATIYDDSSATSSSAEKDLDEIELPDRQHLRQQLQQERTELRRARQRGSEDYWAIFGIPDPGSHTLCSAHVHAGSEVGSNSGGTRATRTTTVNSPSGGPLAQSAFPHLHTARVPRPKPPTAKNSAASPSSYRGHVVLASRPAQFDVAPRRVSLIAIDGKTELDFEIKTGATVADVLAMVAGQYGIHGTNFLDWCPDEDDSSAGGEEAGGAGTSSSSSTAAGRAAVSSAYPPQNLAAECGFVGRLRVNYRRIFEAAHESMDAGAQDVDLDELFPTPGEDKENDSHAHVPHELRFLFHYHAAPELARAATSPGAGDRGAGRSSAALLSSTSSVDPKSRTTLNPPLERPPPRSIELAERLFQMATSCIPQKVLNGFLSRKVRGSLLQELVKRATSKRLVTIAVLRGGMLSLVHLHHRDEYGYTLLHLAVLFLNNDDHDTAWCPHGSDGACVQVLDEACTATERILRASLPPDQVQAAAGDVVDHELERARTAGKIVLGQFLAATDKLGCTVLHLAAQRHGAPEKATESGPTSKETTTGGADAESTGKTVRRGRLLARTLQLMRGLMNREQFLDAVCQQGKEHENTFLHDACSSAWSGVYSDRDGDDLLSVAAREFSGDVSGWIDLLSVQNAGKSTVLIDAARTQNLSVLRRVLAPLLKKPEEPGVGVERVDDAGRDERAFLLTRADAYGNTALHYAAFHGDVAVADLLLRTLMSGAVDGEVDASPQPPQAAENLERHLLALTSVTNIDGDGFLAVAQQRQNNTFLQQLAGGFPLLSDVDAGAAPKSGHSLADYRKTWTKTEKTLRRESFLAPTREEREMYLQDEEVRSRNRTSTATRSSRPKG